MPIEEYNGEHDTEDMGEPLSYSSEFIPHPPAQPAVRPSGFYWVKFQGMWQVMQYLNSEDTGTPMWLMAGNEQPLDEVELDEVNNELLKTPI